MRLMGMPVNNHIDIVLDGRHYRFLNHFTLDIGIFHIPRNTPVFFGSDGKAYDFNLHVPDQVVDGSFIIKSCAITPRNTPEHAHAANLDFFTGGDTIA